MWSLWMWWLVGLTDFDWVLIMEWCMSVWGVCSCGKKWEELDGVLVVQFWLSAVGASTCISVWMVSVLVRKRVDGVGVF